VSDSSKGKTAATTKAPDGHCPVGTSYTLSKSTAALTDEQKTEIQQLRSVRVFARAVQILGTSEKALRWINAPVRSLGDQTPVSLLSSPEGITRVEDALGRIEHGVW
jgi:putative toxin-antitoxin system antitoxin component (TIGR02293 family)